MKFTPKTEDEIKNEGLLDVGIYSYRILNAEDTISKAGNQMIKLTIEVFDKNTPRILYDYLIESFSSKLINFCECNNLMVKYNQGEITDLDCKGKNGTLEIGIEKGRAKPDGSEYPNRNVIKKYLKEDEVKNKTENDKSFSDEDLPF